MEVGDGHVAVGIYRCTEKWQTSRQRLAPAPCAQPRATRSTNIARERSRRDPLAGADLDRDRDANAVKLGSVRLGLEALAVHAPVLDWADHEPWVRDGDAVHPQAHVHARAHGRDIGSANA
jgi:hypothetical protein